MTNRITAKRQFRDQAFIVAAIAAMMLLLWSLVLSTLDSIWRTSERELLGGVRALSGVIGEQVERTVGEVDYTLSFVAYALADNLESPRLPDLVAGGAIRLGHLVLLSVADADGMLRQTHEGPPKAPINLADREHIRVHLDRKHEGLFVGKPVRGRASGRWSIQLTRVIKAADGTPRGVVVGSLDPNHFERFWTSAALRPGVSVELIGDDGVVRAASDDGEVLLEQGTRRPQIVAGLDARSGLVERRQPGSDRVIYAVRLAGQPLTVAVSVDQKLAMTEFANTQRHTLATAIAASCAILAFGLTLLIGIRQLGEEERRSEEARAQLRDAVASIPDAFALFDAEDRLVHFNDAFARLHHYVPGGVRNGLTFEAIARAHIADGNNPETKADPERWLAERMRQHRLAQGVVERPLADGRWLRIEERRTSSDGRVGIRTDITELKARELALTQQTALLTTTLQHMGEGLSVIDAQGVLVARNRLFEKLFDLSTGQIDDLVAERASLSDILALYGQSDSFGSEDGDAQAAFDRSLEHAGMPFRWMRADGVVVEIRSNSLPEGGWVSIYCDITERLTSERRIRSREALMTAMVTSALDAVIVADENGRIREFNPAAEKTFGWRASEVIGKPILDTVVPAQFRRRYGLLLEGVGSHRARKFMRRRFEARAQDRDGQCFQAEVAIAAIRVDRRDIFTIYIRDISDRKKMEAGIQAAREAAEAANRAKSDFLAVVSHEVRTPMNGIIGFSGLLLDSKLDEEQRGFAEGIAEAANRLLRLITDILDLSKVDGGHIDLKRDTIDLEAYVNSLLVTSRVLVGAKPVKVSKHVTADVPRFIVADAIRLHQVLLNLLGNAAKFTQQGTIALSLDVVRREQGPALLRFSVTDTGPGIPSDRLGSVFEPFVQASDEIATAFGGSGLGLAICKRLLERMSGKISVRSTLGSGSTFVVEIPLSVPIEEPHAVTVPPVLTSMCRTPLDILVAEDTPANQRVVSAILTKLGHKVSMVDNGSEAVAAAARHRYDVILMDLQMPVLDGISATRAIRDQGSPSATVPIIALTAQAQENKLAEAEMAGMTGHILKPINLAELAATLATLGQPSDVAQDEPSPGGEAFDAAMLETLRHDVGDQIFAELIEAFTQDVTSILGELRDAMRDGDMASLRRQAHKLQGLLGQFGLGTWRSTLTQMERETDWQSALRNASELSRALPRQIEVIGRWHPERAA